MLDNLVDRILGEGDTRVQDWFMVRSPFPTLILCLSYVTFVKITGPSLMAKRSALNVRWLMVAYNLIMVVVSTWIFYKLGVHGWFGKYNYRCQPVDYSDSDDAKGMAAAAYYYYLTKFVEFADTLFFIARKKNNQITTLHVIHHGIMPMSVWWGIKFTPGGHSTFFAFINSFIHIVMYIYYGLAAIGPHMQKYLWWKKYMTGIQMVQFIAIFVHSFQLLFRECNYPRGFMWWIGFHAVLFWFLFWDFFVYTYSAKKKQFFSCSQGTDSMIRSMDHEDERNNTAAQLLANKQGKHEEAYTTCVQRNLQREHGKDL